MNHPNFQLLGSGAIPELLHMMEDFYSIDQYPFNRNIGEQNIRYFLENEHLGRIWMILNERETIGYIILTFCFSFEFKGRTAFIDELFIKEAYRTQGIGALSVDFTIQQAKELALKALHLEVERHNEKGHKLYMKKGFNLHNRSLMTRPID